MHIHDAEAKVALGIAHEREGTFDAGVVPAIRGWVSNIDARGRGGNDLIGRCEDRLDRRFLGRRESRRHLARSPKGSSSRSSRYDGARRQGQPAG